MSALPNGALHPNQVSPYLSAVVDRPDDAILTDDEVWELQGGSSFFMTKTVIGLGAVAAFLVLTKRVDQLKNFEISGSTFAMSNLVFITSLFGAQALYDRKNNYARLAMHKSALQLRRLLNDSYIREVRKAPKFH